MRATFAPSNPPDDGCDTDTESKEEVAMNRSSTTADLPAVKSSRQWCEHYQDNAASLLTIPWERGAEISDDEKSAIARSLQAWQLGETSDGRHLVAAARRYAEAQRDPVFLAAVRLFIKEEQRHGRHLGRFLDLAGIPRIRKNWGDTIFRALRYGLPNMEIWVTVVIAVESLALTYYGAIYQATRSPLLRAICRQILRDEVAHLRFQAERLAILHRQRPRWLLSLTYRLQRLLFAGTAMAVWIDHRRALRAGGYRFARYWRTVWTHMEANWLRMRPERYHWDAQLTPTPGSAPAADAGSAH